MVKMTMKKSETVMIVSDARQKINGTNTPLTPCAAGCARGGSNIPFVGAAIGLALPQRRRA